MAQPINFLKNLSTDRIKFISIIVTWLSFIATLTSRFLLITKNFDKSHKKT